MCVFCLARQWAHRKQYPTNEMWNVPNACEELTKWIRNGKVCVCLFEWKSNEVSVTEYSAGTDINDVTADDYSVMPLALKIRTILVPHTACTDTGINTPGPCQYVYTIVPCQKHALATSIDIYLSITLMLSQNLPYKLSHNRVSNTFHWYEVLEVLFKPHINIWIKLAQLNHTSERRSTHE